MIQISRLSKLVNYHQLILYLRIACGIAILFGIGLFPFFDGNGSASFLYSVRIYIQQSGLIQMGVLFWSISYLDQIISKLFATTETGRYLIAFVTFLVTFFITGEVFLRVIYWDGVSFSHGGILSNHFHRDVSENKYGKGSRGPEFSDVVNAGQSKILIQGDSISWGQGVKDFNQLYTTRLYKYMDLKDSMADNVQMAVVAVRARDLDDHIQALINYGPDTSPDLIIYQWHVSDLDVEKKLRSKPLKPPWHFFFAHNQLMKNSFFWFFLDYQLSNLMPFSGHSYPRYIEKNYHPESKSWKKIEKKLTCWTKEAKKYTDRLIFFMPIKHTSPFVESAVAKLAEKLGMHVVYTGDRVEGMQASEFDRHPNEVAHTIMAKALFEEISHRWPEIIPSKNYSKN